MSGERLSHSYCHGGSAETPLVFWRSFDRLSKWADETPDKDLIVYRSPAAERQAFGCAEFHRVTDGIACHLIRAHPELSLGSRVMMLGSNCLGYAATLAGVHKAGLVIVSAQSCKPADLIRLADKTDCKALFYLGSGVYGTAASDLPAEKLQIRSDFDSLVQIGRETGEQLDEELMNLLQARQALISADQTAFIYLTSGTTGEPKLVPHSHHALVNSILFRTFGALLTRDDVFFSDRSTGHMLGSFGLFMSMLDGLTLVITPASTFAGDRGAENAIWLLRTLAEERVTSGDFFGYLVHDILQKGGKPPDTLRSALLSGAPTSSKQMERAMAVLPGLVNYYGSTETCTITAINPPWGPADDRRARRETLGRVAPHMEVMIAEPRPADHPVPLPIGIVGEVLVRGYSVMRGYLASAELSRAALTDSGWYRTGDLGSMDDFGRITVTNRIKDLVILAGDNVSPSAVEHVLLGHPNVHGAQVFGVPDERLGEEIAACIVPRGDFHAVSRPEMIPQAVRELVDWCVEQRIGETRTGISYVPRYWAFMEHFPTGATGKVTKASLKEFAASGDRLFDAVEFLPRS